MKAFAFIKMAGGAPEIDTEATPYHGFVFIGQMGNWGAYIISGTQAQLLALNALATVIGICFVTETENKRWPELNDTVNATARTKINTFLTNNDYSFQVPVDWTNKQVIKKVFRYFSGDYALAGNDVAEP